MTNLRKLAATEWSILWIYTNEEWRHFETWNARRRGILSYLWHSLFYQKPRQVPSVRLTEQWVKIGDKRKYFCGPVTQLKHVSIYEQKGFNMMSITYEILSKGQLNEIRIPIPKGKLREAIDAQEKLLNAGMTAS